MTEANSGKLHSSRRIPLIVAVGPFGPLVIPLVIAIFTSIVIAPPIYTFIIVDPACESDDCF